MLNIDIYEDVVQGRTDAIGILNNVEWVLGYMYGVRYMYENNTHVLIGTGISDTDYVITGDSLTISQQFDDGGMDSLHTSVVKVNGAQYQVLNGNSEQEIDDPFSIQEL